VAGSAAPLIGGWLAGAISYQWMFIISTIIGVVSLGLMHFAVHDPRKTDYSKRPSDPLATRESA
jgi:MFS family permease